MPTSKKNTSGRIILGIDPGYADLGYGVITQSSSRLTYITCDNISSPKTKRLPERLLAMYHALDKIIRTYKPDLIAIEKLFFFKNHKTAIDVAQARGIVLLASEEHRIPIAEYTPVEVKQSLTSYGFATKPQVAHMVHTILHIDPLDKKDDAIDALAIAVCAAFRHKHRA